MTAMVETRRKATDTSFNFTVISVIKIEQPLGAQLKFPQFWLPEFFYLKHPLKLSRAVLFPSRN